MHKAGYIHDPNNYRVISLINSVCKIFCTTCIFKNRLEMWCDQNDSLSEFQAGFRPNYSTTDQVFSLQAMIQKNLSKKNGRFYCIFIDFAKAFDCVNHEVLFQSLINMGIRGKFSNIIISSYQCILSFLHV